MTVDSAKGTPFEGLREAGAREDDVLCLLLLYHRHVLKERSPLKRHIDALPREYHQTIFYSGACGRFVCPDSSHHKRCVEVLCYPFPPPFVCCRLSAVCSFLSPGCCLLFAVCARPHPRPRTFGLVL